MSVVKALAIIVPLVVATLGLAFTLRPSLKPLRGCFGGAVHRHPGVPTRALPRPPLPFREAASRDRAGA